MIITTIIIIIIKLSLDLLGERQGKRCVKHNNRLLLDQRSKGPSQLGLQWWF